MDRRLTKGTVAILFLNLMSFVPLPGIVSDLFCDLPRKKIINRFVEIVPTPTSLGTSDIRQSMCEYFSSSSFLHYSVHMVVYLFLFFEYSQRWRGEISNAIIKEIDAKNSELILQIPSRCCRHWRTLWILTSAVHDVTPEMDSVWAHVNIKNNSFFGAKKSLIYLIICLGLGINVFHRTVLKS